MLSTLFFCFVILIVLFTVCYLLNGAFCNKITFYVKTILNVLAGSVFYLLAKISHIFEDSKYLEDYVFYEIKKSLIEGTIINNSGLTDKKSLALLKIADDHNKQMYFIVKDDGSFTMQRVIIDKLSVTITNNRIKFFKQQFISVEDMTNYIEKNTCLRLLKFELI